MIWWTPLYAAPMMIAYYSPTLGYVEDFTPQIPGYSCQQHGNWTGWSCLPVGGAIQPEPTPSKPKRHRRRKEE
jgi:hypothetical protein